MSGVFTRERRGRLGHRSTHKEKSHVMTEIGLIQLQAKEWQGLLATARAGRGEEGFFPRAVRGNEVLPKL